MEIVISRVHDKYAFSAGELLDGHFRSYFSSLTDSFLIPGLKDTYEYMGAARLAAHKIAHYVPSAFLAKKAQMERQDVSFSPKDTVLKYFQSQLDIINERFSVAAKEAEDKEEYQQIVKALGNEVGIIMKGMDNIIKELKEDAEPMIKLREQFGVLKQDIDKKAAPREKAAASSATAERFDDLAVFLAGKIMDALRHLDDTIFVKEVTLDEASEDRAENVYRITFANKAGDLVDTFFTQDLLLTDVVPYDLSTYPMRSKKYYHELFEPIVNAVGNYYDVVRDTVAMPHHPSSERYSIQGFRMSDKQPVTYAVAFKDDGDDASWWASSASVKTAAVSTAEEQGTSLDALLGKEVKFVNPDVPSLLNRNGTVRDYYASEHMTLFDVDFMRGLGVVTVNKNDVVLVSG